VQRIVVTHAMNPPIVRDIAKMKEAAQLGAFIEFVGGSLESADASARMDRFAAAIKAIGPEHCILSSTGSEGESGSQRRVRGILSGDARERASACRMSSGCRRRIREGARVVNRSTSRSRGRARRPAALFPTTAVA
jgi:hypothetical protein